MSLDAWIAVVVVLGCLATLIRTRISPDLVLMAGLAVLLTTGVLSPVEALAGFSNEGMLTVACLYVVAAGLRETGGVALLVERLLVRPRTQLEAQARVMLPVMFTSAFINNTPVVAAFLPAVSDWARKLQLPASKIMLPLSYAAIFGGTCTLIGTSTNLVVNGLLVAEPATRGIGFFEIAWVGVPCAVLGFFYVLLFGRWLLPNRSAPIGSLRDPREYTVEMVVESGSPLAGKTIEAAGLRHLRGLYLVEINRDGRTLAAVGPEEVLEENDHLVLAGITESIVDLQKIKGLAPATDHIFKLDAPRSERALIEAVVSGSSPMAGKTIREGRFRSVYSAVVIAVAREGRRIESKIGDIRLKPGDTLLLEAPRSFLQRHDNSRDFLLLRPIEGGSLPRHERGWIAWLILLGVVLAASLGLMSMFNAALLGAGAMVLFRCLSAGTARRSLDLEVLLVIAAAFGIGKALQVSGAAGAIAGGLLALVGDNPWLLLVMVYVVTSALTEVTTNNAAAVLMFPMAHAAAVAAGLDSLPFAIAIMMAASASFATPIGYQTNLMVYGPGGYRFSDYLRFGIPLNVLVGVATVLIIPMVWPF